MRHNGNKNASNRSDKVEGDSYKKSVKTNQKKNIVNRKNHGVDKKENMNFVVSITVV